MSPLPRQGWLFLIEFLKWYFSKYWQVQTRPVFAQTVTYNTLCICVQNFILYLYSWLCSDIRWLNKMMSVLPTLQQWLLPWLLPTMAAMAITNNGYHGYHAYYQQWLPWLLLTMFTMDSTNNGYHDYYQQWLLHM